MKAIDRFDYTLGNRFSTYATWWIRQSISRGLSKKADMIRLPLNVSAKRRKAQKVANILHKELGYQPSYEEIAERTGMRPKEIHDLFEGLPHSISLQTNVGEDGELGDLIVDEVSPDPEEVLDEVALTEAIEDVLDYVRPRERRVLKLRFGLGGGIPRTLAQVGKIMELSRERIRQIEGQALRRLRRPHLTNKLRDFVST